MDCADASGLPWINPPKSEAHVRLLPESRHPEALYCGNVSL